MKSRNIFQALALFTGVLFALSGCFLDDGGSGEPGQTYETTSVDVAIDGGSGAPQLNALFVGTFADVASVTMTVVGEDKFGVPQNPLATATLTLDLDGVWRGTIPNLPIGPTLTFTAQGFDAAAVEVFSGVTTQVLTGSAAELVVVAMAPNDDGVAILFPIITSITRPAEIINNTAATVSVAVTGSPNETLGHAFASGGGTFTPDSGTIVLPASGTGTINTTYTAPAAVGTVTHSVRVTNSQGNAVESDFTTLVVYALTGAEVEVTFAPVITALLGKRTGNDVAWTATVSDDKPLSALSFLWSFAQSGGTAGSLFSVANANPGVQSGYDQTVVGTVTLGVTDGDGLTTTISFALVAGQFPDNVVVDSGGKFAYVGNFGSNTVSVIETAGNTVVATVPVGITPDSIAITPDGSFAYVTHFTTSNLVTVIETAGNTEVTTVTVGTQPRGVAITPDGSFAYVANNGFSSNNVSVIETAGNTVVDNVPVGTSSRGVAITPDGSFAYVANTGSNNVSVIETAGNTVVDTVPVGNGPRGVAITP